MPRISQEQMDSRRQEILEAALRCFARKGFHQTTMRDIFEEVGLSAGAVYSYFDNKKSLIEAVVLRDREKNRDAFAGLAQGGDAQTEYERLVSYYFDLLRQMADKGQTSVFLSLAAEAAVDADVARLLSVARSEARAFLMELTKGLAQASPHLKPHTQALADLLFAVYQGTQMSLALGDDVDVEGVAKLLRAMQFEAID